MNDIKRILILFAIVIGVIMLGFVGGCSARGRYDKRHAPSLAADTITLHHTDTVTLVGPRDTLTRIVWKPYPVAVHDTTLIVHHTTDSFFIMLPYQHKHLSRPDTLDVWYSGIDPKVDSARVYMHHTTEIVNIPVVERRMPRLTMDVGAGTAIVGGKVGEATQFSVRPYGIARVSLNRPRATFSGWGRIDTQGAWGAGVDVSLRLDVVK